MTPEEFNKPRYEVIAEYPGMGIVGHKLRKGDIIEDSGVLAYSPEFNAQPSKYEMSQYPYLFRRLKWYERRTMEEFASLRFVKFIKDHYWRVGDVVKVESFMWDLASLETVKPKIIGFKYRYNESSFDYIVPATEEEFKISQKDPNALKH